MSAQALTLAPGARLIYDGDLVEVVELDGARVWCATTGPPGSRP